MDDRLNIGLVDTHGESDSAAEDSDLITYELLLDIGPLLISLAGVVSCSLDPVGTQVGSDLLGGPPSCRKQQDRGQWLERV